MRRSALLTFALIGCGRLGFDVGDDVAMPDGPTGTVAITSPPDGSHVGSSAHVVGTCTAGIAIRLGGSGLAAPGTASCDGGRFAVDLAFTAGTGAKPISIDQAGAPSVVTVMRVDAPIEVRAASSGQTQSAGPGTDCDLVIPAPDVAEHDLLIGMVYTDNGAGGSVAVPAGFTRLAVDTAHGVGFLHFVADLAAEPASYTFHIVAGNMAADTCASGGALVAFVNVDPIDQVIVQSQQTQISSTLQAPAVTATANSLLVGLFGSNGPGSGIPGPSVMTTDNTAMPNGAFGVSLDMFANARVSWQTVATTASTAERTTTIAASAEWLAGLVDLRPR